MVAGLEPPASAVIADMPELVISPGAGAASSASILAARSALVFAGVGVACRTAFVLVFERIDVGGGVDHGRLQGRAQRAT